MDMDELFKQIDEAFTKEEKEKMKASLKDVVLGTPAGNKAVKKAMKKSCEDQLKLLRRARNETTKQENR